MAGIKLIVAYPAPKDVDEFETRYTEEHIPMAAEKLGIGLRTLYDKLKQYGPHP